MFQLAIFFLNFVTMPSAAMPSHRIIHRIKIRTLTASFWD